MAINPQRLEDEYQFWATTDGFGKKVQDAGGDGGPRRGGKAKFTETKVFDDTGETLTETNLSEDGSETKVIKKTPASLLEDQSFLSDDMDLTASIAEAPDSLVEQQRMAELYQQQRELAQVRDLGVRYGDEPTNLSPVYSFDDDRYLLNHEYYGDDKASVFPSAPSSTSVSRSFLGNVNIDKHGSAFPNDGGNLAISDSDRANAQSKIIQELNEDDMLTLSVDNPEIYAEVVAGNIPFPSRVDPHANKDYTTRGFDGSELHAAALELETEYAGAAELVDEITPDDTELSKDETNKVIDAVKTIGDEDPDAIAELNNFADWAEGVSNEESQAAAEEYLQALADEPTVNDRFKKAMAIAFAAMLFGDDFSTAMNTGLGVVGDDYANEAATEAAAAATQAELNKTLAKERRTAIEWDRQKQISFAMDMRKKEFDAGVALSKEERTKLEQINNNNYKWMDKQATGYYSNLDDYQKEALGMNTNFGHQYDMALQFAKRAKPDVVWDLEANENQRSAFNTTFEKWLQDSVNSAEYGGAPDFSVYMQDAFIKTEMADMMLLPLKDTNPTIQDIKSAKINPDTINWNAAKENTKAASKTIESLAGGVGEANTLKLLAKDYKMFQKSDEFKAFEKRAHQQGIGAFIYYVNVEASRPEYLLGTAYDKNVNTSKEVAAWLVANK